MVDPSEITFEAMKHTGVRRHLTSGGWVVSCNNYSCKYKYHWWFSSKNFHKTCCDNCKDNYMKSLANNDILQDYKL